MMAWKLAARPATAARASTEAPAPLPKMVWKASSSGSSLAPTSAAPGAIPALRNKVRTEATIRVRMPQRSALGMSRLGLRDSSEASGNCSMAR